MIGSIRAQFDALKKGRRLKPEKALLEVGATAGACVEMLRSRCDRYDIGWKGKGDKDYHVYTPSGVQDRFSRAVRTDLFVDQPDAFRRDWNRLVAAVESNAGTSVLSGFEPDDVDRLFYTAVTGFAAAMEAGGVVDRGGPGTFYEMTVGPAISLLSGIAEGASIRVPVPGDPDSFETITTDLSFAPDDLTATCVVLPTKISTRERISQAYVHQAILEKADPTRRYRSALCIGAETNMFGPRGESRTVRTAYVKETLVPRTILLYQRYIAELEGLYYLDPPHEYLNEALPGFPRTRRFSDLLTGDLPALLA